MLVKSVGCICIQKLEIIVALIFWDSMKYKSIKILLNTDNFAGGLTKHYSNKGRFHIIWLPVLNP